MRRREGLTALVTGASSGIGREVARVLASQGLAVVAVGRSGPRLEALAGELGSVHGVRVWPVVCDLSRPAAALELSERLEREGVEVDVLVNNAGVGLMGPAVGLDPAAVEGMLGLNVVSLTTLSAVLGRRMAERRRGWILNIGSVVGYFAVPYFAAYAASKAYVRSWSAALRQELAGSGVSVTCVSPGYVRTGFDEAAGIRHPVYRRMSHMLGMEPAVVARACVRAMWARRAEVVVGWRNRLMVGLVGMLPWRLSAALMAASLRRFV